MRKGVKVDEVESVTITVTPLLLRLLRKLAYDAIFEEGFSVKEYDALHEFGRYLAARFPLEVASSEELLAGRRAR